MAPIIEATQLSPDEITEAPKITPDTDITKHGSHGDGTVNPVQQNIHVDWTPAEERRAVRKVDLCILPIVMLGFFSLQVDRGNISSALTSGLRHDINITQDIINNGQTILYASIIAGEIPSNLLLQRIGAKWWLPFQMLFWGFVATIQITMKNATGFYICRCFLGLAESGFIPGGVYYISTFYTRRQFAARVGLFWIGNYIGKGCSGLMAAGIFSIKNDNYTTWQWLFMIEGVIALFIGAVALVFLPRSPEDARTLIPGFHMLTKRERHILTTRLLIDNPSKKDAQKIHISFKSVLECMMNWRLFAIHIFALAWTAPISTLETYNVQITTSLGFSVIHGNALSSVGYWIQIPILFLGGWCADKLNRRGPVIIVLGMPFIVFTGVFRHLEQQESVYIWTKYAIFQMMVAFTGSAYMMGIVWATLNARTPTQRSVHSAMYVMFTNAGQAIGGQMFRGYDAPRYLNGLIAVLSLQCFSMLLVGVAIFIFWYSNKNNLGETGKPDLRAEVDLFRDEALGTAAAPGTDGKEKLVVSQPFRYAI